jgi:hypothetical protein
MRWGRRFVTSFLAAGVLLIATGAFAERGVTGREAPELASGAWINTAPLTMSALRGRVVLVEFWTFG